jgi:DNA-binding Xre family transcriptional regulator
VISYSPLWETMKLKGATTYTLRFKGGISGATLQRLQRGESVSTNTLDALCNILNCEPKDIIEYTRDN